MKRKLIIKILCFVLFIVICGICLSLYNSVAIEMAQLRPTMANDASVFTANDYTSVSDKPILANGHLGYVPFGDSIYMNGLFNGYKGNSHRARIPNYANIHAECCRPTTTKTTTAHQPNITYSLDIQRAVFVTETNLNEDNVRLTHTQYAHRFYDSAIVNTIQLNRDSTHSGDTFRLKLVQEDGGWSEDLQLISVKTDDKTHLIEAETKIFEDSTYQTVAPKVYVLREIVPEFIEIPSGEASVTFSWLTIIQHTPEGIRDLFEQLHQLNADALLESHTREWTNFWDEDGILVDGNDQLAKSIQSSLYAIASSLPSLNRFADNGPFYGLSPSGLGLGGPKLDGYRGHNFWDTETWMHPAILLIEPEWSERLLNYRHLSRRTAYDNAKNTSYKGLRFPWESAFTGREVTVDGYEYIVEYQQHITADIGHAVRQHFFSTFDVDWMHKIGFELAQGIAEFWASRVSYNEATKRYDINGVMGPDEDHWNINNNPFTNVGAALSLYFGSYAACIRNELNGTTSDADDIEKWLEIASKIRLLYDPILDYNPQFDGYDLSMHIKQADVALLGYPLQYANIGQSTRRNNLKFYENVTRTNGPAMTWSMHAIGHLDIDEIPDEQQFRHTFEPYVRMPYYVWNEYVDGVRDGASNFITGAGGFLQLILYGYVGIRIQTDSMTIDKTTLPPHTDRLKLNGIWYMQQKLSVEIMRDDCHVTFRENPSKLRLFIDGHEQNVYDANKFSFKRSQKLKMMPRDNPLEMCPLPRDVIDQIETNAN